MFYSSKVKKYLAIVIIIVFVLGLIIPLTSI